MAARRRSIDQGLVGQRLHLPPQRVGGRRHQLSHQQSHQLLAGIDPEHGARRATPAELPHRAHDRGPRRVQHHRHPESEADALIGRLAEHRLAHRGQVASGGQVVGRHVLDRLATEDPLAVQLAAVQAA